MEQTNNIGIKKESDKKLLNIILIIFFIFSIPINFITISGIILISGLNDNNTSLNPQFFFRYPELLIGLIILQTIIFISFFFFKNSFTKTKNILFIIFILVTLFNFVSEYLTITGVI